MRWPCPEQAGHRRAAAASCADAVEDNRPGRRVVLALGAG